ncbi:phage tail tape measure protein [Streptococcus parasuis]|uniref:phage tail tape measure protein n=1 Tax=Streptococcus parasuis TaxID=1501662 RepID=UPI001C2C136C|nr:phage tail tape measure protein [Streptococcus parasuis]MBV1943668.1 phage tail tape measure protein [Streptococcus parasuis]QXF06052.1 phage tail tape measure protein [Streptococcus parasuis]
MAETFEGLFVKFGANTVEFDKSVKGINGALAVLKKDIGNLNRELKFNPGNVDLLNRKLENFQEQARLGAMKIVELKKKQDELGESKVGSAEWVKLQVQIEQVETQMKSVDKAIQSTKEQLQDVGDSKSIYNLNKQLDDVANELDIVNQKLELDSGNVELVEQKMKLLAKQSELAGDKVQALKKKQADLGDENIGTDEWRQLQHEISQAEVEVMKIDRAMDELGDSSKNATEDIKGAASYLKADMMMDVAEKAGEAGRALYDVGEEAMQTAAKMQASNAQFSTVFGELENQARTALESIGKELNIVPERLQGSFTQMAAFAKTTGMDTAGALELTERATRAAADGAAFYDKSIEEVTENLQSFLKGNYENDAALGISATETTRNAAANALYGKSFKELSESQKQLTLLKMVEDGQAAAGALGQAARESDGLENTLGNLKASTDNAMGALGAPILKELTPIFQELSKVIQSVADWFSTLDEGTQQTIIIFGLVTTAVLMLLGAIAPLVIAISAIGAPVGMVIAAIVGAIAAITLIIEAIMNWGTISEWLQSTWDSCAAWLSVLWTNIVTTATTAWSNFTAWLSELWSSITSTGQSLWSNFTSALSNIFSSLISGAESLWSSFTSTLSNLWSGLVSTGSNLFNNLSSTISGIFNGILSTASNVWNSIKSTISNAIDGAKNAVSNAVNAIKNLFNFQIKWPHIPLPHFRVSGSANPLDWLKGGLPSIGIDWYAKGGIMTKPTLFGMNGNRAMVGGEAGAEAILPLNKSTLGAIGQSIANTMNTSNNINVNFSGVTIREEADLNRLANVVGNRIAEELQRKTNLRG